MLSQATGASRDKCPGKSSPLTRESTASGEPPWNLGISAVNRTFFLEGQGYAEAFHFWAALRMRYFLNGSSLIFFFELALWVEIGRNDIGFRLAEN